MKLHVLESEHDAYAEINSCKSSNEQPQRAEERIIDYANEIASAHDRDVKMVLKMRIPHRIIIKYTVKHDIDQIIMGSHGRSLPTRSSLEASLKPFHVGRRYP
ncbi:universal stress protein [Natronococcus wangiae]|uniref:universal stress protein n=1 Tax=Natronococcus wangiae TaxID=3068275 RepID=UPI00387EC827